MHTSSNLLLIDSHVHMHDSYNLNIYFDNVFNNFSHYANQFYETKPWKAFLLLTDMKGVFSFDKLKTIDTVGTNKKYSIQRTNENISLKITSAEGNVVFIVNGKQIIAEDKIEVLALCTNKNFDENESLSTTIKKINNENAIAVLPWGVGKWMGKRKEVLNRILTENREEKFYLGDNSGRPIFWSEPDLFKLGNNSNHFVLPGTDALALPNEIDKTASYGFYVYEKIDENKPAESIKKIIATLTQPPKSFGKLENTFAFFKNQIIMQLNKRK